MTGPIGAGPLPARLSVGHDAGRPRKSSPGVGDARSTSIDGTAVSGTLSARSVFRVDAYAPRAGSTSADAANAGVAPDAPPADAGEAARLQWAAEQLESLFIHQLWKSMRRTVIKSGMFDGTGVRLFEEMLDEERSRVMAGAGGIGLARLIYEQMSSHIVDEPADDDGRTTTGRREDY